MSRASWGFNRSRCQLFVEVGTQKLLILANVLSRLALEALELGKAWVSSMLILFAEHIAVLLEYGLGLGFLLLEIDAFLRRLRSDFQRGVIRCISFFS